MRTLKEINLDSCKLSILNYNDKYIFKFEQGALEFSYKVKEMDVFHLDMLVEEFTATEVGKSTQLLFEQMATQLKEIMQRYNAE